MTPLIIEDDHDITNILQFTLRDARNAPEGTFEDEYTLLSTVLSENLRVLGKVPDGPPRLVQVLRSAE